MDGLFVYHGLAQAAGQDLAALEALLYIDQLHGSDQETAATLQAMRHLGITEVIFDPTYDHDGGRISAEPGADAPSRGVVSSIPDYGIQR